MGLGGLSIWHWLVVLAIVAMVFGTKKLRNIGADLGGAVKGFKEGMKDANAKEPETNETPRVLNGETIDVPAKEKSSSTH